MLLSSPHVSSGDDRTQQLGSKHLKGIKEAIFVLIFVFSPAILNAHTYYGSGFFVNHEGYIATAKHLVSGKSNLKVSYKGNTYPATLVGVGWGDVAIIHIATHNRMALNFNTDEQDNVYSAAIGFLPGISSDSIADFSPGHASSGFFHSVNYDMSICHGMSGGPVINSDGAIIGMVAESYNLKNEPCGSPGYGPAASEIVSVLNQLGVFYSNTRIQVGLFEDFTNQINENNAVVKVYAG